MDNVNETARETLEKVLLTMEEKGCQTYMVGLNKREIEHLLEAAGMAAEEPGTFQAYKGAYDSGFQRGYQTAVLDMGKRIKEMRTFGGDKQEKRAD